MTDPRRRVRVTESFFEQLDALLPSDRGPNGEPSATDFLVIDLPSIVDSFATGFDALPEVIEGVPAARMLIAVGRLVGRFVVFGLEAADGSRRRGRDHGPAATRRCAAPTAVRSMTEALLIERLLDQRRAEAVSACC